MLGLKLGAGPAVVAHARLGPARLGAEGYELAVTRSSVRLSRARAGRALLRRADAAAALRRAIPAVRIRDRPRFAWRGAMLDVARHFRSVRDVKRYIDLIALYKLNRLHLHLSDDQGWRIAIAKWPRLATHGGQYGGRRRQGRLLHPGAVLGHRPLRRRAVRDDRARDRHARARPRRALLVPEARVRRQAVAALHRDERRLLARSASRRR